MKGIDAKSGLMLAVAAVEKEEEEKEEGEDGVPTESVDGKEPLGTLLCAMLTRCAHLRRG